MIKYKVAKLVQEAIDSGKYTQIRQAMNLGNNKVSFGGMLVDLYFKAHGLEWVKSSDGVEYLASKAHLPGFEKWSGLKRQARQNIVNMDNIYSGKTFQEILDSLVGGETK